MKQWKDEKTGINFIEPTHAEEWLGMLRDVAADYDGHRSPEGLMHLIDELVEYAEKQLNVFTRVKFINQKTAYFKEDNYEICMF